MPDSQLVQVVDLSLTYPNLPGPTVERKYLLETIDSIFDAGLDCVVLEGPEQVGKTYLAAQFAKLHGDRCFCLFLQSFNSISGHPTQIRYDLGNQIRWFVTGQQINVEDNLDTEYFRNLVFALQRKIRQKNATAYFVIDGLDAALDASPGLDHLLASTLPLGSPGFRFVLSSSSTLLSASKTRARVRPHTLSSFSLSESQHFLAGLDLSPDEISEVHHTFRGIPGSLSTVRRLLEHGHALIDVLQGVDQSMPDIYEPEWRCVDPSNIRLHRVLSAIAFLSECSNLESLGAVVCIPVDEVRSLVSGVTFVRIDEPKGSISFVSESIHRYARSRLVRFETEMYDAAIARLNSLSDSTQTLQLLPEYLQRTKRLAELSSYLTSQRIAQALVTTRSASTTLNMLSKLQEKSFETDIEPIALRCVMSRLVLSDVVPSDVFEARIEEALARKDDSLALSIANSAELNEQRLTLLAIVARVQRTRGTEADPALLEEIRRLAANVDFAALGERSIDLAADLALSVPDLAVHALESISSSDSNALDLAIVRSTIKAVGRTKTGANAKALFSGADKLTRSDVARKVMRSAALLWQTDDATEVLKGISSLSTTSEQLFFARQWLRVNYRPSTAVNVALGVSRLILADTSYAPNATVFRDLSLPLSHADRCEDAQRLMTFLEGQSEYARNRGPFTDYFRLRLHIAKAKLTWFGPSAITHFEDEALSIESVEDVSIRAACYARLIQTLRECRIGSDVPDTIGLLSYARSELHGSMARLLTETADHTEAAQVALQALARTDTGETIKIVEKFNTESRRDRGYEIIGKALLADDAEGDIQTIKADVARLLRRIVNPGIRQGVAAQFLSWMNDRQEPLSNAPTFDELSFAVDQLVDPDVRARILSATLAKRYQTEPENSQEVERLWTTMMEAWRSIEDDGIKIRSGFRSAAKLGDAITLRDGFLRELNDFANPRLPNLGIQATWSRIVLLQGRSLAILASLGLARDVDLAALEGSALNILSQVERARYLSKCSLYVAQSDPEMAKKLIERYVAPRIAEVMSADPGRTTEAKRLIIESAPALWLYHAPTALRYFSNCDSKTREWALDATLQYVLKGRIPGEPWRSLGKSRGIITEPLINEVVTLLREVESDITLCETVEFMAECCRDRQSGSRVNINQKADLLATLKQIVTTKLPSKRGIQHEGYLVYLQAQLLSLERGSHPEWKAIIARARRLPNLSDSCYVLSLLCQVIPRRHDDLRRQAFDDAIKTWRGLPTIEERLSRLETLSDTCKEFYESEIRAMLKEAILEFSPEANPSASESYRNLIEAAHKIDEEWAASLVSVSDSDPVRSVSRREADRRLKQLKLQSSLSDGSHNLIGKASVNDLVQACWDELGVLNASRVPRLEWDSMIDLLRKASGYALVDVYPVVALVLATAAVRYRGVRSPGAQEKLRQLSDAVRHAAEVVQALAASRTSIEPKSTELLRENSFLFHVAESGGRTDALDSLVDWLRQHRPTVLDIVDPYYRPSDSETLTLFARACQSTQIRILTSLHAQEADCSPSSVGEALRRAWAETGLSGDPPQLTVYVVGTSPNGHMGIHDRWWLADGVGLEFGSSINGVGRDKTSIIRTIDPREVCELRRIVDPYFHMLKRSHEGQKLTYMTGML